MGRRVIEEAEDVFSMGWGRGRRSDTCHRNLCVYRWRGWREGVH